jgi:hypothetical protein
MASFPGEGWFVTPTPYPVNDAFSMVPLGCGYAALRVSAVPFLLAENKFGSARNPSAAG